MVNKQITRYLSFIAIGIAGFIFFLIITSSYGLGLAPDSANYISAAESFAKGHEFRTRSGYYMISWPPFYSAVLGSVAFLGVDALDAARFVNSVSFFLLIICFFHIFAVC